METYKKKTEVHKHNYVLTMELPVSISVEQGYDLYEDEFGNPFYEKDCESVDEMHEVKKQNPCIQKMIEYIAQQGWKINEEIIE